MAIKVLVTAIGQQIVADVKQVENKDTKELVGYWLENPRVVSYVPSSDPENTGISVRFGSYCAVSDENAFSLAKEHVVAILEPREDVREAYTSNTVPVTTEETTDEPVTDTVEAGTDADSAD
jgi:hypothetical protein